MLCKSLFSAEALKTVKELRGGGGGSGMTQLSQHRAGPSQQLELRHFFIHASKAAVPQSVLHTASSRRPSGSRVRIPVGEHGDRGARGLENKGFYSRCSTNAYLTCSSVSPFHI